jgi:hypothetical protein
MKGSCELRARSCEQTGCLKLEARGSKLRQRRRFNRLQLSAKGYENEM